MVFLASYETAGREEGFLDGAMNNSRHDMFKLKEDIKPKEKEVIKQDDDKATDDSKSDAKLSVRLKDKSKIFLNLKGCSMPFFGGVESYIF